jgi:hypothetical protein
MSKLLIDITDFRLVTDLDKSCKIERLEPFIMEAQDLHLSDKLGWSLLSKILEDVDNSKYNDLLNGSYFELNGKKYRHFGLKRVLVHYSYGIYKYLNNYVDMPYGTVYKEVQDSVPVQENTIKKLRDQHFNLASKYWQDVALYLCANKNTFIEFNCTKDCGCKTSKSNKVNSRLTKVTTFKKWH